MNDTPAAVMRHALERAQLITKSLTKEEFNALGHHLANGCLGKLCFIGEMGAPQCKDTQKKPLTQSVPSTWKAIENYDPLEWKPFALAVYDRNESTQMSTWAAFDLDWHHLEEPGQHELHVLFKLWQTAREVRSEIDALILETSGRGAHIWLIAKDARSLSDWHKVLVTILRRAACDGVIGLELFPASQKQLGKGKALRLPGSVNVNRFTQRDGSPISRIIEEVGLKVLSRDLPQPASNINRFIIGSSSSEREKKQCRTEELAWLEKHRIDAPACRHNRARALIVEVACYRPSEVVLRLCEELHRQANPSPRTSLIEHRDDCKEMLADWMKKLTLLFSSEEAEKFKELSDSKEIAGWHCIHNWHRFAVLEGRDAFAASTEALGRAIGFSYKTASVVLKAFVAMGFLRLDASAVRCVACARYRWLLPHLPADEIKRQLGRLVSDASNIKKTGEAPRLKKENTKLKMPALPSSLRR